VVLPEAAIAPVHLQFSCQPTGDYVEDLTGQVGSQINGRPLQAQHRLCAGDMVTLGNLQLEYALLPEARTAALPLVPQEPAVPRQFIFPLRLPGKKQTM
jgi:pSer/pThr/pTyr-binding forkhead associated (FHA) protein